MYIERCYTILFPELNGYLIPLREKAEAVIRHIGDLNEKDAELALYEVIDRFDVPVDLVAKAENLLPEVTGGNVDHEIHMDEANVALSDRFYRFKTPP